MSGRNAALRLAAALVITSAAAHAATADTWQPLEQWRIDAARIAPWAPAGTRVDPAYRGREVRFETARLAGPEPIVCDDATYEWSFGDAAGLFEGNLPEPAAAAALQLGLGPEPIATLRVTCANAGFDFHRTAGGDLLLGLDNVVWTLRATRAAQTPAEIVQELLIVHFTHDRGFTPESVALKSELLSANLRQRIARYFSAPQPPDEVPPIDGDPFTDSQEYPDRFTLGSARAESARTVVPVNFPLMQRRVDYVLVTEDGRWVLDDLVDERGGSLRELLDVGDPTQFAAFLKRFRAALAGYGVRLLRDGDFRRRPTFDAWRPDLIERLVEHDDHQATLQAERSRRGFELERTAVFPLLPHVRVGHALIGRITRTDLPNAVEEIECLGNQLPRLGQFLTRPNRHSNRFRGGFPRELEATIGIHTAIPRASPSPAPFAVALCPDPEFRSIRGQHGEGFDRREQNAIVLADAQRTVVGRGRKEVAGYGLKGRSISAAELRVRAPAGIRDCIAHEQQR